MKKTLVLLAAFGAFSAQAQTTVKDPWVRGTVAGQKATGMFAQITSASGGKLVRSRRRWPAWSRSTRWRWTATS